ncbi:hypothetical protein Gpo141_00007274 [Globisporangium polare]
MVSARFTTGVLALVAAICTSSLASAQSTSLPNWVGPKVGAPSDTACYRKTLLTKVCPTGYKFDNVATCWAECPIEYPVECAMECIPQNKDCALEIITKVNAVATVAISAATSGVFGQLSAASKGVQQGVKCGQQLFSVVTKVVGYVKELEVTFPSSTQEQILYLLGKSDLVIYDLPVAVATCAGLPIPTSSLNQAAEIVNIVKNILNQVLAKKDAVVNPTNFLSFVTQVGAGKTIGALSTTDLASLETLLIEADAAGCGAQLKKVIDDVVVLVKQIKAENPSSTVDIIRLLLSNSNLFLKDIPAVTSSCVPKNETDAFAIRDDIRKTLQVIIDKIIDSSSSSATGKPLTQEEYAFKIIDYGLDVIAMFDPIGVANLAKEYIQPICGPTSILGEIDDGSADVALGMRTVGQAFTASTGVWSKSGDGNVTVTFVSVDTQDVSVNVMAGGTKIAEVPVKKGTTVVWTKRITDLKDKTLYLDRWRPGFLGIPGTGGGSLLLWIPHASTGGHLNLRAQLNVS